jgi:hypothetical protein
MKKIIVCQVGIFIQILGDCPFIGDSRITAYAFF